MEMILKIFEVLPANVARLSEWIDEGKFDMRDPDLLSVTKKTPLVCREVIHPTERDVRGSHISRTVVSILNTKVYQNDARKTRMVVEIKVLTHHLVGDKTLMSVPRAFMDRTFELLGIFSPPPEASEKPTF